MFQAKKKQKKTTGMLQLHYIQIRKIFFIKLNSKQIRVQ